MKTKMVGVSMGWMTAVLCGLCLSPSALADAFRCEHQLSAPVPILSCTDQNSAGTGQSAWVTLRKMPAWGTHAGLTIVDLCLKDELNSDDGRIPKLAVDAPPDDLKKVTTGNCKRRYCTDKKKAFSFLMNSFPFPIGWTAISFQLGFQTQSFSISCDEFTETIDGRGGNLP